MKKNRNRIELFNYILPFGIIIGIVYGFTLTPDKGCPIKGDNKNPKFQHLDSLKNRTAIVKKFNKEISFADFFKKGDDTKRFSVNDCVDITAYVKDVKYGGKETCQCHSDDKKDFDIHIELVQDLKDDGEKMMVVEINRFLRAGDKSLDYDAVRELRGKKVEVKGYLFFDEEHWQNAVNTNPKGTNLWRATCWEIHPVFYIQEVK
jgi:hypothetical protein